MMRIAFAQSMLLCLSVVASSCAHVPVRTPLPTDKAPQATVLEMERARHWGDEPPPWEHAWLTLSKSEIKERYPAVFGKPHTYLAISGGGSNGAFGAGLLAGWTESGDRPEFTMVTGISAGALTAPFAFLGSEYDHVLKQVSSELTADEVYNERRILKAMRSDALASTEPLQALLAKYIDEELVEKLAAEHRRGRRLNIGTTDLDSMRPMMWRVSAIAASGHPDALELIRQILLASASMPGFFTPVLIEVEADGRRYDELHVDGGVATQVFLYPIDVDFTEVLHKLEVPGKPKVYIIRNGQLDPQRKELENKIIPIVGRSLSSLTRTQGLGDLYRIYLETFRDGLDFNLAYIPASFTTEEKGAFDTKYMRALFDVAYDAAKKGYPWEPTPPELRETPLVHEGRR
jgi:predicted acylesterase/phospholipase RssA